MYTGTRAVVLSSFCKSGVYLPYRDTACLDFDIARKTYQHHDKLEATKGLSNANSKSGFLLDNNIYAKQLFLSMQSIQDMGMIDP